MIPLTYAEIGEEKIIKKVGGSNEVRTHLKDLGFVPGSGVTLINVINGNTIVKVKESRIAINEELARKIMV